MVKSMGSGTCFRILSHVTLSKFLKVRSSESLYKKNGREQCMYHTTFS